MEQNPIRIAEILLGLKDVNLIGCGSTGGTYQAASGMTPSA